ncbi:hypothetical protein D3C86_1978170 [compost metagenome]
MAPFFVSPGAIAKAEAAKNKLKVPRSSSSQRNSVGYVQTFVGPQRRPKGRMPIEMHAECGFHAIRPPSPRLSGRAFHAHPAICSTAIRPGSRSAATQVLHC